MQQKYFEIYKLSLDTNGLGTFEGALAKCKMLTLCRERTIVFSFCCHVTAVLCKINILKQFPKQR